MSTSSPSVVSKLARPSWGRRRSAMSMLAMIFRRLMMPACSSSGYSRRSCRTPSTRQRIASASSRGSMWMSEAFMPMASIRTESTISMIEASSAPGDSTPRASPFFSSISFSLPRLLVKISRLRRRRFSADGRHHALLGAQADLVDYDHVERVGHGDDEATVVVQAQGQQRWRTMSRAAAGRPRRGWG